MQIPGGWMCAKNRRKKERTRASKTQRKREPKTKQKQTTYTKNTPVRKTHKTHEAHKYAKYTNYTKDTTHTRHTKQAQQVQKVRKIQEKTDSYKQKKSPAPVPPPPLAPDLQARLGQARPNNSCSDRTPPFTGHTHSPPLLNRSTTIRHRSRTPGPRIPSSLSTPYPLATLWSSSSTPTVT